MFRLLIAIGVCVLVACAPSAAQTVAAAVEVYGLGMGNPSNPRNVLRVQAVQPWEVSVGSEKWAVVGACSNAPSLKIEIVNAGGIGFGDLIVEFVRAPSAVLSAKRVCITNSRELSPELLRLLKLID